MRTETSHPDDSILSEAQKLDAIVDAVCQGRLTPADVAGLGADELEAIYAWGQMRLESGQVQEAITMWAALVALDPYQARAWRALGIGHHHAGAIELAKGAYQAALYLEPTHGLTAVYAAEAHLLLGDWVLAEACAKLVRRSQDAQALARLEQLWASSVDTKAPFTQRPKNSAQALHLSAADEPTSFCLLDGRDLPLTDSSFAPAGQSDEATLVYDLMQACNTAHRAPAEASDFVEPFSDITTSSFASLPPPRLGAAMPAFVAPKERTLTGTYPSAPRVLPEATARRRMGRMLTEEITLGPQFNGDEEITQAHTGADKKVP